MKPAPVLVLVAGLVAAGSGAAMLLIGSRVEGLVWFAAPVTALGLVLIGIWLRAASAEPGPGDPPGAPVDPASVPGRWYPAAILAILTGLAGWFVYWTKFR
jgi:hypothetical protein